MTSTCIVFAIMTNALEQLVDVAVRTSSEANGVESIRRLDKAAEAGLT